MSRNLLTREQFREGVFARDGHKCVFCGRTASETPEGKLDAHHILERRLWDDGGYYLDNGATVCEHDHLRCEMTVVSVEAVREAAGITHIITPDDLYDSEVYDKWGNPILANGQRGMGPLFWDESVQKILKEGGVLDMFTPYVKYSRTMHLPWSPGLTDDDRMLKSISHFEGQRVIATKKMDGENTSGYSDGHIHARSINSGGGEDRAWAKNFLSQRLYELPQGWRLVGENVWAEHSIHYEGLDSLYYGISLWNERNVCLSWDQTLEWFELLGITPVPVLFDGIWDEAAIRALGKGLDVVGSPEWQVNEGYVIRLANEFPMGQFRKSVAKFVRKGHVQTAKHWRQGRAFIPNELKK